MRLSNPSDVAAPVALAVDHARRLDDANRVVGVQLADARMVGIAEYDVTTALIEEAERAGQLDVIWLTELAGCVPLEVGVFRDWEVWRVEINEITTARFFNSFPEIFRFQFGVTERPRGGAQVFAVVQRRV